MVVDSPSQVPDSIQNDSYKRAYYLTQISFSVERVAASNLQIMNGLFHSEVISKDRLDNSESSEKVLQWLADGYSSYEYTDKAYYYLLLSYSRLG